MNIEGTEVNPKLEVVPKVDVIANQIARVQADLDMLNDVLAKRIQITNQRDRDNIEQFIKDTNEELSCPVIQSNMVRQGMELAVIQEYRAELRGRLAVFKELIKSDKIIKEQITETENVLKQLLKKQQAEK